MDPNMMASQMMGPAPFFYYTPEPNSENRQHGHFSQHPAFQQQQQQQMQMYPVVPTLPSTPIYSRPSSSCSQPPMQAKMFNVVPSNMTPMASPQMAVRKPAMLIQNHSSKLMLETDMYNNDNFYYPATPPLSSSGSNIGSPDSSDILATPMNPMFSGLEGSQKTKPDLEAVPESLENLDWSNCGSPPMTPGKSSLFLYILSITTLRLLSPFGGLLIPLSTPFERGMVVPNSEMGGVSSAETPLIFLTDINCSKQITNLVLHSLPRRPNLLPFSLLIGIALHTINRL
jgi:hypothetical protein